MECYLVGGAVRDALLGCPVTERDWVVVGETPEAMLAAGFTPVGKDFPVFLHPVTHEEYALARTERKSGPGYKGFTCYAAPDVTLIQDLQRRDLTINAIAQSAEGVLIDPYGGQADLTHRVLRHVSPAFEEDPVRILRVARFSARLKKGGFTIAPDTLQLMQTMVKKGEINALVAERVWQETEKALSGDNPAVFFEILSQCQALPILWPELQTLDYQEHLATAALLTQESTIRFAVLVHRLELSATQGIIKRYKIGRVYQTVAQQLARYFQAYLTIEQSSAQDIVSTLEKCDAIRRKNDFEHWLVACGVLAQVLEIKANEYATWWRQAQQAIMEVDINDLIQQGLSGAALKDPIHQLRIQAVAKVLKKPSIKKEQ